MTGNPLTLTTCRYLLASERKHCSVGKSNAAWMWGQPASRDTDVSAVNCCLAFSVLCCGFPPTSDAASIGPLCRHAILAHSCHAARLALNVVGSGACLVKLLHMATEWLIHPPALDSYAFGHGNCTGGSCHERSIEYLASTLMLTNSNGGLFDDRK